MRKKSIVKCNVLGTHRRVSNPEAVNILRKIRKIHPQVIPSNGDIVLVAPPP